MLVKTDSTTPEKAIKKNRARRRKYQRAIWKRDQGICQICGLNTWRLYDLLYKILRGDFSLRTRRRAVLDKYSWAISWDYCGDHEIRNLSEVDHVTPLCEGGEDVPSNLRLLCKECHRKETAKLIQRIGARGGYARTRTA